MHLTLKTVEELERAERFLKSERLRVARLYWTIGPISEQLHLAAVHPVSNVRRLPSKESDMALVVTSTQQASLVIAPVDKRGNPAVVENVRWSVSDSSILSIAQDATDPNKAVVKAVGPAGSAQANVLTDPIVGEGEGELSGVVDVTVIAGQASVLTVNTGTPEEQPEGGGPL